MSRGNVVPFPYQNLHTTALGQYIRLGDDGAKALASLFASGHFRPNRVVVDASRFDKQAELIAALRRKSVEIVLDTKCAELAAPGKFGGRVQLAPWAAMSPGKALGPDHFQSGIIAAKIAEFAVSRQVDAVIAPTHWIGDPDFARWFDVDVKCCVALRRELDRTGGKHISIDYSLIAAHMALQNDTERAEIVSRLRDAPFENLWVRAAGFGNNAAPLSTRRHMEALADLHSIERPIGADYLGGMTGAALLAFGAVSGIAHGIGKFEAFSTSEWRAVRVRKDADDGPRGPQQRVALTELNRSLTPRELEWLARARNGRKHVACSDRSCCPRGVDDMVKDPRKHAAHQSRRFVDELSAVPDLKRADHFIDHQLKPAEKRARLVSRLKPEAETDADVSKLSKLMKRLAKHADYVENLHLALNNFREENGKDLSRAKPLRERQAQPDLFPNVGRR